MYSCIIRVRELFRIYIASVRYIDYIGINRYTRVCIYIYKGVIAVYAKT